MKYVNIISLIQTSQSLIDDLVKAALSLSGELAQQGEDILVFEFKDQQLAYSYAKAVNDFYYPARVDYSYKYHQ